MHNLKRSKIRFSEILWNLNSLYSLSYTIIPSICQNRAKILICPSDRFRSDPFFQNDRFQNNFSMRLIIEVTRFRSDPFSEWPIFEITNFAKRPIFRKDQFFEKINFSKWPIFEVVDFEVIHFSKWTISEVIDLKVTPFRKKPIFEVIDFEVLNVLKRPFEVTPFLGALSYLLRMHSSRSTQKCLFPNYYQSGLWCPSLFFQNESSGYTMNHGW